MHTLHKHIVKLLTIITLTVSSYSIAFAQEVNTESFSGTVNTTLTSGFTIRASERDCEVNFGYQHTSVVTAWGSVSSQNGAGCSAYRTDAYGNTSTEYINLAGSNPNSDDGNLNYDRGDVVNATQKFYTEVIGDANGVGVNLSLTGSYNPVDDITTPAFKKLKAAALDSQEQDLTLLNAYITTEFDTGNNYIDATIGRSVVSWGEATFIPITANGLVTGALDITKLRAPGSSIKEALLPVEQIVLSTNVDGIGFEGYYQFQSDMVEVDVAGSFFGNEVVGRGHTGLIAGGSFSDERVGTPCPYQLTVGASSACTASIVSTAQSGAYASDTYIDTAFDLAASYSTAVAIGAGFATTKQFGTADMAYNSLAAGTAGLPAGLTYGNLTTKTTAGDAFYQNTTSGFISAMVAAAATPPRPQQRVAGVQIFEAADGKFKRAKDDGQFGLKLTTYIDEMGGIDLSVYAANYHSKVPYLRIKGQQGLFAGDLYGLYSTAVYDQLDNAFPALAAFTTGGAYDGAFTGNAFGQALVKSIQEVAYSSSICGAVLGKGLASAYSAGATGTKYTTTVQERAAFMNYYMSTAITGEKTKPHDPSKCYTFATGANTTTNALHNHANAVAYYGSTSVTDTTGGGKDTHLAMMGTAAGILAAITPINYYEYDFVFPEDNKIFGASFSTVVDGTVVQGELSYRPDFPLATPGGSQVNQLNDASGATQMLNWVAFNGLDGVAGNDHWTGDATADGLQVAIGAQVLANASAYNGSGSTEAYTEALRDFKRSSLPAISNATVIAGDYYSTPYINYDVWSADIGTTSAFNASHPITLGLGADSVVFLTELGIVHIADLNNTNGYVARGGSSESGDSPEKCKGAFGTSFTYAATKGVDAIGAGQVDGLFGNGGYCENNPGAESTSLSYRLIGSATYNNFANSQWSVSPNIAWSHDPSGYGPNSLGGFVEGRMSLALGMNARKGAVSASLSYVNQLGDPESNLSVDKDTIAASVSYAF
ncbi:DUF1302 domain-containing protein [Pelagibacteraceae bacterium]|nr:DUF1302 domain-containing protein [Pelagibacteraceae bacterium]